MTILNLYWILSIGIPFATILGWKSIKIQKGISEGTTKWWHLFLIFVGFMLFYLGLIGFLGVEPDIINNGQETVFFSPNHIKYILPIYLSLLLVLHHIISRQILLSNTLTNSAIDDACDAPYILGFCCTLFALFVTFAKFDLDSDGIPKVNELIAQSAAALLTTLAGMVSRVILRGTAEGLSNSFDLESVNATMLETKKIIKQLSSEQKQFASNISDTSSSISNHQKAMKKLSDTAQNSKVDHEAIYTHQGAIIKKLEKLNKSLVDILGETERHSNDHQKTMDEISKTLSKKAQWVEKVFTDLAKHIHKAAKIITLNIKRLIVLTETKNKK